MHINSEINVLGSIEDLHLVELILNNAKVSNYRSLQSNSQIKTEKSFDRYKKAIQSVMLHFPNKKIETLLKTVIQNESISPNSLFLLFWNTAYNNDLFHYLNQHVYFPALYSGRTSLKNDEIDACLMELKATSPEIQSWSKETIHIIASKYLTLLKKFQLVEGKTKKELLHYYLTDMQFLLFLYWVKGIDHKSNILSSHWLPYSLMEKEAFMERILQKKYKKWLDFSFTGEKLSFEMNKSFEEAYYELNHP